MGLGPRAREHRWYTRMVVWFVCFLLGFLLVLHQSLSHTSYLGKSIWGLSGESISTHVGSGNEQSSILEAVTKQKPTFHASPTLLNHSTPSNSSHRSEGNIIGKVSTTVRKKYPRVAICLVGGARAFELTGLSIKQHVLDAYNNSDVFLHVPLDYDVHKLTLLKKASGLAMAKVFENDQIPESDEAREVLTGANSPNGIQGLLQYFRLVEGCLTMISSYETKHGFKYDWIVRTRVDGYWRGPLPPLATLSPRDYHVPYGCKFGGLNDRLGIGTRNTSWVALSRLSLIPKLYEGGYRYLNSEQAFKHQFDVSNVSVKFDDFRFCILTARKYSWPLTAWDVPVASIKSRGALNGAKCKPCDPVVSGDAAAEAIKALDTGWGWINPVKDLKLCDARLGLKPGWESMFDKISGRQQANARKWIERRTEEQCIEEVYQFGQLWETWDAPTPEIICRRYVNQTEI